jgi:hypothetical protein
MKALYSSLLCLSAGLCAAAHADGLLVQVPAVLDSAAPITSHVRSDCAVPELVGKHVLSHVAQRLPDARAAAAPQAGSTEAMLKLTLLGVYGAGGGSWSGAKSVALKAELVDNGQAVAATVLQQRSRGGVLGGVSGTCPIFERIAEALGRDVAAWLPIALVARDTARQTIPPAPPPAAPAQ